MFGIALAAPNAILFRVTEQNYWLEDGPTTVFICQPVGFYFTAAASMLPCYKGRFPKTWCQPEQVQQN